MYESSESDTESEQNNEKWSPDEGETVRDGGITEYEKKRHERIKENKARMEALKLTSLASSLLSSSENKGKKKLGKEKKEEDEEYKPSDGEEMLSASSEEGEKSEEEDLSSSPDSDRKGKGRKSLKKSNQKKKPSAQKHVRKLDFKDDEEALQQAIALSLEDSADISRGVLHEPPQKCKTDVVDMGIQERKGRACVKEDVDKRKKTRRLNTSSRLQITEDQVIIHFFQFDEAGKGGITTKDLKRVAVDHDFSWSDDELANMIHFFDNDGDSKLNLDDFRKILHRCNMIKE